MLLFKEMADASRPPSNVSLLILINYGRVYLLIFPNFNFPANFANINICTNKSFNSTNFWCHRFAASFWIARVNLTQVELYDNVHNKTRQMICP